MPELSVSTFMIWQLSLFWGALCISMIVLILTQHIKTEGLVPDRKQGWRKINFARLQLMVVVLLTTVVYLIDLYNTVDKQVVTSVPTAMLILVACSNAFYLYSKFKSANRNRF